MCLLSVPEMEKSHLSLFVICDMIQQISNYWEIRGQFTLFVILFRCGMHPNTIESAFINYHPRHVIDKCHNKKVHPICVRHTEYVTEVRHVTVKVK
jgi:hypothetical protein